MPSSETFLCRSSELREEDVGLGEEGGRSLFFALQLHGERGWTNREHPASDPTFLSCQRLRLFFFFFPKRSKILVRNQVPDDAEGLVAQLLPW